MGERTGDRNPVGVGRGREEGEGSAGQAGKRLCSSGSRRTRREPALTALHSPGGQRFLTLHWGGWTPRTVPGPCPNFCTEGQGVFTTSRWEAAGLGAEVRVAKASRCGDVGRGWQGSPGGHKQGLVPEPGPPWA